MDCLARKMKNCVKKALVRFSVARNWMWGNALYGCYRREYPIEKKEFLAQNRKNLWVQPLGRNKAAQIARLLDRVDIVPAENDTFFYSLDCFKTAERKRPVFGNYTPDYSIIVKKSFRELEEALGALGSGFGKDGIRIIRSMKRYLDRCREDRDISARYGKQLDAVESLFWRPAETFFEGLQRILYFNQFLWQTGHKLNGFGRLDHILIDLYRGDIREGRMTEEGADGMLRDFFRILHRCYWFKSSSLMGDTGQVIVLGGLGRGGGYCRNELTDRFIRVSEALRLPDPKVLLRCSQNMPEDLIVEALECIATGIGAPLLSNDDAVVPALMSFGYDRDSAYGYVTSACWEPLVPGNSCDQNNVASLNFAEPFVEMLDHAELDALTGMEALLGCYQGYLSAYLGRLLKRLSSLRFEENPLLSLLSESAMRRGKDIVRGGAEYNNIGLTSVGMGSVVNSLLNVERLVYRSGKYTLSELNAARARNYASREDIVKELKSQSPVYGSDADRVVELTKQIEAMASEEMTRHLAYQGGKFKFGLSSPSYISDAATTGATLDGRRNGEPFGVHISSNMPVAPTELLSFAARLDYTGCRLNGNVVDFIVAPSVLRENIGKYAAMLRVAFQGGLYQLQMNVLDSGTLIAAKGNPERFPNLIVRVWGFSAYFNDLPEEYKDVLIARALESEKAA